MKNEDNAAEIVNAKFKFAFTIFAFIHNSTFLTLNSYEAPLILFYTPPCQRFTRTNPQPV